MESCSENFSSCVHHNILLWGGKPWRCAYCAKENDIFRRVKTWTTINCCVLPYSFRRRVDCAMVCNMHNAWGGMKRNGFWDKFVSRKLTHGGDLAAGSPSPVKCLPFTTFCVYIWQKRHADAQTNNQSYKEALFRGAWYQSLLRSAIIPAKNASPRRCKFGLLHLYSYNK